MKYVIACKVFQAELEYLQQMLDIRCHIRYLEQGLHDTPKILQKQLQDAITETENEYKPNEILLAYGLCGRGFCGVHSQKSVLVVPKVHDCIPLLLGIEQCEQGTEKYCYWMSEGWLKYSQIPFVQNRNLRFAHYCEKFGESSARYLIDMERQGLKHYLCAKNILWKNLPCVEETRQNGKITAADAGLSYQECYGSDSYLRELLFGGKNKKYFIHLNPQETLEITIHGELVGIPCPKVSL